MVGLSGIPVIKSIIQGIAATLISPSFTSDSINRNAIIKCKQWKAN